MAYSKKTNPFYIATFEKPYLFLIMKDYKGKQKKIDLLIAILRNIFFVHENVRQ